MSQDYKKQISRRITKNLFDVQLLPVLEKEPRWGYKITKTFESEVGVKLRHGALYPALNCLEKEGFLTSQKQPKDGRARKTYTLTPKGEEYLQGY